MIPLMKSFFFLLILLFFLLSSSVLYAAGGIQPTPSGIVEFFGTYAALAPHHASSSDSSVPHAIGNSMFLNAIHDILNNSMSSAQAAVSGPFSIRNPDFTKELAELFVLGKLFAGHSGGILSPNGTDLGDLFILSQLFR